jgi:hypothetical protein
MVQKYFYIIIIRQVEKWVLPPQDCLNLIVLSVFPIMFDNQCTPLYTTK